MLGMREYLALQTTVGGVSQYKFGLISNISSNASLHQHFKV